FAGLRSLGAECGGWSRLWLGAGRADGVLAGGHVAVVRAFLFGVRHDLCSAGGAESLFGRGRRRRDDALGESVVWRSGGANRWAPSGTLAEPDSVHDCFSERAAVY